MSTLLHVTLFLSVIDNMKSLNLDLLLKEAGHDDGGPQEGSTIKARLAQKGLNRKLGPRGRIKIEVSPFPISPLELQCPARLTYPSVRSCGRSFVLCAACCVKVCKHAFMHAGVRAVRPTACVRASIRTCGYTGRAGSMCVRVCVRACVLAVCGRLHRRCRDPEAITTYVLLHHTSF